MYFWIRVISRPAAHFIGVLVSRQTNLAFCLVCLALLSTFTRYPRYLVVIVGIPVHTRIYVSGSSSNERYDHDTIMISLARTFVLHSSMHGGSRLQKQTTIVAHTKLLLETITKRRTLSCGKSILFFLPSSHHAHPLALMR